jgi:hypothetical protein
VFREERKKDKSYQKKQREIKRLERSLGKSWEDNAAEAAAGADAPPSSHGASAADLPLPAAVEGEQGGLTANRGGLAGPSSSVPPAERAARRAATRLHRAGGDSPDSAQELKLLLSEIDSQIGTGMLAGEAEPPRQPRRGPAPAPAAPMGASAAPAAASSSGGGGAPEAPLARRAPLQPLSLAPMAASPLVATVRSGRRARSAAANAAATASAGSAPTAGSSAPSTSSSSMDVFSEVTVPCARCAALHPQPWGSLCA